MAAEEILDAKARVGAGGLGCEPASAASVAGARQLVAAGVIGRDERVVCILTGHQREDPTATVAYHTTDRKLFNDVLGSRGVSRAGFANPCRRRRRHARLPRAGGGRGGRRLDRAGRRGHRLLAPRGVSGFVAACVARNLPLAVATTGLEDRERRAIAEADRRSRSSSRGA